MEIIVQETDKDVFDALKTALEMEGFQVYAVLDTEEDFLEVIDKEIPHVVILDYRLDGKGSIAILKKIKFKGEYIQVRPRAS